MQKLQKKRANEAKKPLKMQKKRTFFNKEQNRIEQERIEQNRIKFSLSKVRAREKNLIKKRKVNKC